MKRQTTYQMQFKTGSNKLTELVKYGCKLEEKVKAMKSEIKKNAQGTNSDGKETRLKSMVWTRRKKEIFNHNIMKKQEFKKTKNKRGEA